jgi:predicted Zn finger-like uncharacterized protein
MASRERNGTMIVACPHCSAVYELPRHLLGPGGAAVRCPHCTGEFTLGADGEVVSGGGARDAAHAAPPPPAPAPAATAPTAAAPAPGATAPSAAAGPAAKPARKAPAPRAPAVPPRAPAASQPAAARGPAAATVAPADAAEETDSVRAIARRVLEELVARKGPAMKDANARGKLLSEFGPDLIAAFEEFRKESGATNHAPFREEMLGRWGIDLRPSS